MKNCTWIPASVDGDISVVQAKNRGLHDFGFKAMMPESIEIDGLEILDAGAKPGSRVSVLSDYSDEPTENRPFAYKPTKKLEAANIRTQSGREVVHVMNEKLYRDLEIAE